nr:unnamed protein product [Callosobruchus chinensis]
MLWLANLRDDTDNVVQIQRLLGKYFSPSNLLTLYKAQIRPSLEYCSHIWGAAAPTTLSILDAVQRRAIRLIGDPALTCHLQLLSHRRAVGDLSLFYRYSNASSHSKAVLHTSRTERYDRTFVPRMSRAWNVPVELQLSELRLSESPIIRITFRKKIVQKKSKRAIILPPRSQCLSVCEKQENGEDDDDEDALSLEEIRKLIVKIPGCTEVSAEDVGEWMVCDTSDPGFQILNDDEIVVSVREDVEVEVEEELSADVEVDGRPSASEAFAGLETALKWMERQPECDDLQLLTIKRMQSAGRQLKLRNTSSLIVLPCAEEEARIWKLSRRREDRIWNKVLSVLHPPGAWQREPPPVGNNSCPFILQTPERRCHSPNFSKSYRDTSPKRLSIQYLLRNVKTDQKDLLFLKGH